MKGAALLLPSLALAGCATTIPARMYSQTELAGVARSCAVALGEVAQFEEEPRLLFLLPVQDVEQFRCVSRWAEKRSLRLVYLENFEKVPDAAQD